VLQIAVIVWEKNKNTRATNESQFKPS
jgi:hypothetical protein